LKAITRLMSVLLPEPLGPTSAVVEPAALERDAAQDREGPRGTRSSRPRTRRSPRSTERLAARVLVVLGRLVEDLANSIEARRTPR
jgi:hypothetical protein